MDSSTKTETRSAVLVFVVAGVSLLLAIVTGIDLLGKPLRMVNLVKIIGLSIATGVFWMKAVEQTRQQRS